MTIDYRIRNIVIAAVLAAAAGLLTIIYVTSAERRAAGKESVTVYVPSKDFAIGTAGCEDRRQPREADGRAREARTPDAVTSPGADQGSLPHPAGDTRVSS